MYCRAQHPMLFKNHMALEENSHRCRKKAELVDCTYVYCRILRLVFICAHTATQQEFVQFGLVLQHASQHEGSVESNKQLKRDACSPQASSNCHLPDHLYSVQPVLAALCPASTSSHLSSSHSNTARVSAHTCFHDEDIIQCVDTQHQGVQTHCHLEQRHLPHVQGRWTQCSGSDHL